MVQTFVNALLFFGLFSALFFKICNGTLQDEDQRISKLFMDEVDPKQIEKYLIELTRKMHRAGTQESLDVAEYIRARFVEFGLKPVEIEDYDVMLSYPNPDQPDTVTLVDDENKEVIISNGRSPILEDSEAMSKNADLQFLAFGKPGTAISKNLVYANYGRLEDFRYLADQGISINGSIVLIRYGFLWRGTKVRHAQQFGAASAILYSDPMDYHGLADASDNDTFPNTDRLPDNDVQRGTLMAEDNGDLLTPLLPAKDYVSRKSIDSLFEDLKLPNIPATVIGYGDALKLLQELEGAKAPQPWQGLLPTAYNLGGKFKTASKIKVTVNGRLEIRKIRNVIAYIKGSAEPDRYVILGNHHDAWTYGALDPSSGTSALLEAARVFSTLVKQNKWTPRRTLMFCAFDAEEYGLIGSTEWVEQNLARLQSQSVVYLNIDTAVTGQYALSARGVPLLKEVLYEVAKRTKNPNETELKVGIKTVYESWIKADKMKSGDPRIDTLVGSGSDYKPFLHYAGIPVMDFRYGSFDRSYPLYHTLHDTLFFVKQFVDPTFAYHRAVVQLLGEAARLLADSPVIPFNLDDYTKDLLEHFVDFQKRLSTTPNAFSIDLAPIVSALDSFKQATKQLSSKAKSLSSDLIWASDIDKRAVDIRIMNERLMQLDRFFIQPGGTPGRPSVRHTLFGPGISDAYTGVLFPGVDAALQDFSSKNVKRNFDSARHMQKRQTEQERLVAEQISWVAHCLHAASDWLNRDF